MTITLYAQPYDLAATGFYFEDAETFLAKSQHLKNEYDQSVEEFEIQFIEGEDIDGALFKALGIHEVNVTSYLEHAPQWEEWEKINIVIIAGECGYAFDIESDDPDHFGVTVYGVDSLRELAIEFLNDGIFGEIPTHLENYIDIDALAADLRHDYTETVIANVPIVYRAD
ncbi:MAG: antirestriction protein ArdA [Pseudomonadota bacterium]